MKTSCIERVPKDTYVVLKKSFLSICDSCFEAAILLAYFESWHNFKINAIEQNKQLNDIAEKHGDSRTQDETLYQHHTSEKIYEDCMGMVSQKGILKGRKKLVELGYISEHKNPNPKYSFDNTVFYLLHSDAINISLNKLKNNELVFNQNAEVHTGEMEGRSMQNGDTVQAKWRDDTGEMPSLLTNIPSNVPSNIPSKQTGGEDFSLPIPEQPKPPLMNSPLRLMTKIWQHHFPAYVFVPKNDNVALREISEILFKKQPSLVDEQALKTGFSNFCKKVKAHSFYCNTSLGTIRNKIQDILMHDSNKGQNASFKRSVLDSGVPQDEYAIYAQTVNSAKA